MNEEDKLIKKLKSGNEAAFEKIFHLYSDRLFLWAYKITGDSLSSADIVQDFFIYCWEKKDLLPSNRSSFKAYAYKSIYNASLNYIRNNKRFLFDYEIATDLIDDEVDEDLEELKKMLLRLIDELPKRCKEIFVLTTLEKKKYTEVADLLGISVNTVKVQVSKAYRILRKEIG